MFSLEGKRAYITGGLSGIGRAVAELFIENGAQVAIVDIVDSPEIAEKIGAFHIICNVTDEASVSESFKSAVALLKGELDIVVLNAGVGDVGPNIENTEQSLLEKITKVNQWGVFYGLKHAPAYLKNGGSIIATSSMASVYSVPGSGVYSAAKAAINSMTSMAALELGERGIRVNSLCPGYVNTTLGNTKEEVSFSEKMTALGRHAEPKEDIAPVFLFFASEASRYITGQSIAIDAGMNLGAPVKLLELVTGRPSAPGS